VKEPPSGTQWLLELKFDGYQMLCHIDRGNVTIWSRDGKDWTQKFLNAIESVKSLDITSAILDGETVIVDAQADAASNGQDEDILRASGRPLFQP
jgi:bifunctional non-homologous end joining protein LigD